MREKKESVEFGMEDIETKVNRNSCNEKFEKFLRPRIFVKGKRIELGTYDTETKANHCNYCNDEFENLRNVHRKKKVSRAWNQSEFSQF